MPIKGLEGLKPRNNHFIASGTRAARRITSAKGAVLVPGKEESLATAFDGKAKLQKVYVIAEQGPSAPQEETV